MCITTRAPHLQWSALVPLLLSINLLRRYVIVCDVCCNILPLILLPTPSPSKKGYPGKGKTNRDPLRRKHKAGTSKKGTNKNGQSGDTEAPPPQGSWAKAPLLDGDTGYDSSDNVKVDNTLDEECLSDDDLRRGNKYRFTPAGEAALAVDTAAGVVANEGSNACVVGLRRRGEGARWDSAALGMGHKGLPQRYGGRTTSADDSHVWMPLTNPAEMEYYRFAVAPDPGEF